MTSITIPLDDDYADLRGQLTEGTPITLMVKFTPNSITDTMAEGDITEIKTEMGEAMEHEGDMPKMPTPGNPAMQRLME